MLKMPQPSWPLSSTSKEVLSSKLPADCEQSRPAVGPPVPVESIPARLILGTEDVRRRLNADFPRRIDLDFVTNRSACLVDSGATGYWKAQAAKDKKIRQKVLRSTVRTLWAPFAEFIEVRVKLIVRVVSCALSSVQM